MSIETICRNKPSDKLPHVSAMPKLKSIRSEYLRYDIGLPIIEGYK